MLVLTRKINESIRIGDDITVRVLEIKGSQVRLGIEAPEYVKIYRDELYRKVVKENLKASRIDFVTFEKLKKVFRKK